MQKHECTIYVLLNDSREVFYVGRTSRPIWRRMSEHRKELGKRPTYSVIDRCSRECWKVEKYWIERYRDLGAELKNVDYGQGPHRHSEATRKHLSEVMKGRQMTWADKISAAQKGVPKNWSANGRKRVQKTQFKKGWNWWATLSPEERERQKQIRRDAWKDPEKRARMCGNAWKNR